MTSEPTPEDLARNPAADLALCAAATPPPWVYPMPGAAGAEAVGAALVPTPAHPRRRGLRVVATSRLAFKSSAQCGADGLFIAAAREGWPAALRRLTALEAAVREHRDQRGDDRCWRDDRKLYAALPEGYTPPAADTEVELDNCRRYIASRQDPATAYISPQRRIEELEAEVTELKDALAKSLAEAQG